MKYVIAQNAMGHWVPVVFDPLATHKFIAAALKKDKLTIVSAGFVHWSENESTWVVSSDKSESLGLGPQPMDSFILNLFLKQGLSGLDLMNMLAFMELQAKKGKA